MPIPGLSLGQARTATAIVSLNGTDVSNIIGPHLISLSYKDEIKNTSDNVTMRIADPTGKFRLGFALATAVPMNFSIVATNFNGLGTVTRDCGSFEIHRIEVRQSKSSGTTVDLHGTSVPVTSSIRRTKKSKSWIQQKLSAVATTIAKENNLAIKWLAKENPLLQHTHQHDQSDFNHLMKHFHQSDLLPKIKNKTLHVASHEEMEHQAPVGTIVCPSPGNPGGINGGGIISWDWADSVEGTHASATVSHRDHKTGKVATATVKDPKNKTGEAINDHTNPHYPNEVTLASGAAPADPGALSLSSGSSGQTPGLKTDVVDQERTLL